ncbi:choice-of-anchor D domain-containing protein [Lutibacter sp.]|uniref:choice-of-anchor D domain-containing protein n=1 Tax=Lutibacter sp. TaxID=1925666 RepID=UPI001A2D60E1|nr:choice-of-anchor D domain-containing protein [Lutibacter sp.]MBI9040832.1 choice-of-anchor D domain-containing protein [Lutibacter sp.]
MRTFKPQFKQLLFSLCVFISLNTFSQTTIASQNFDTPGLSYVGSDAGVIIDAGSGVSGSNSLWFGNSSSSNIIFDNVNISSYTNVAVSISFASINANNGKDLFLDISYDNGVNWQPEVKLIEGENGSGGEDWPWGTPDNDPLGVVVTTNPYIYNVPNGNNQVKIRVRASSADNRYFYIDNILVQGTSTSTCTATGTILLERYDGITGTSIANLLAAPNYPNSPTTNSLPTSFEAPTNIANDYGVRIRGTICAPETGTYYFWVAGDDNVVLNLSTDNTEANKTQIAYHNNWTNSREWNKYTTQKSLGITLIAGQSYYIEALMKEGAGGDNLAVGWRKPSNGDAASPFEVIPGTYLSPPKTTYCDPTYSSGTGFGDYIDIVTLGTLIKTSGASSSPYYSFFNSETIPDLTQGSTASISITFGSDGNQYAAVWIDFNQDGNFDASEGFLASGSTGSNGTTTINITVPAAALTGNTRMRVRGGDDSALGTNQACGASNSSYGETEDYIVNIVAPALMPEINIQGNGANIVDGSASPTTANHTDFGNVNTSGGTLVRTFTIQNSGLGVLNLSGTPRVAISGANAGDFTVTVLPSATVVGSGGSTTFQITFDPSADGIRNATVTIVNNDSNENPYDFSIRGTGITSCTNPAAPTLVLPSGATSICNGNSLNLNATSAGNTIYWYTQATGGSSIGSSVSGANFSVSPTSNTTYYAEARTIAGGCISATRTATALITVNNPPTATINYSGTPFCKSVSTAQGVTLTGTGSYTGGTYSASPSGLSINSGTGVITPSTSTAGTYTVTYTIAASGGCSAVIATRSVTITSVPVATFSYTGTPYCSNAANPSPTFSGGGTAGTFSSTAGLNFVSTSTGQINLATSTPGTYTVTNTITASGGCSLVSATSNITINAAPTAAINYSSTSYCKSVSTTQGVTLTGTGSYTGGTYSASPSGLSINSGTGVITPSTSTAGTYTVTYTIAASGGCSAVIATRSVTITSVPVATFSYTGTPYCSNAANPSPTFSGGGTAGTFSSTAGLNFVSTSTGQINLATSTPGTYTVTNTITASGGCSLVSATSSVTITQSPTITGTTPASRPDAGSLTLGATASSGTISWYANLTGGSPLATGTSFITPGIISTTTYYVEASNGSCVSTPRVPVVATIDYAEITVLGNGNIIYDEDITPITTDYTNLGSSGIGAGLTRTYTIQNSGTINLTVGTITISGVHASEFVVTAAPAASVAPSGSTTFSITFTPTALGTRNANVSFVTNDPDENPFNFDIAGTGTTGLVPEINLKGLGGNNINDGEAGTSTAAGTDFGNVTLPGTVVRTFTIQNTGTGPLLLTGVPIVTITGSSYFTVTAQPSSNTIAAGNSLTFQITFNPAVTGTALGIVNIYNNDSNESIYDFAIKGSAGVSGREIDIQGNEVSIIDGDTTPSILDQTDFGVTDATTPISMVYTVHNFGDSSLTINSVVSITGANSSLFSATPLNSSLAAGGVDWFVITFTPTAATGVKTATITVTSNDADEGTYDFVIRAEVQNIPVLTVAPGGVTSNLKFWLKADSNIGSVSDNNTIYTWYDQTFGSTKNAISKFSKEPKFRNNATNNVNFNPVVYFNGNNYMSGGQGFNDIDMFVVVKPTNNVNYTSNAMDIYCGDDISLNGSSQDVTGFEMGNTSARHTNELMAYNQGAGTGTVGFGVAEISTTKFYTGVNIFNPRRNATYPTVKMDILNNGNTLTTSAVSNSAYKNIVNSRYWLGRSEYWDASYDGDILEIINYNVRNSDADKRKIETYLAIKYGITLGNNGTSVDYVNSAGTIIYGAGASFNYNIAGIGRDDKSQLNQKQSKTENTVNDITIGLGDIYSTNSSNPNMFTNDKDFLVWGHNNNTLSAQTPIIVNLSAGISGLSTPVDFTPIGRVWRVVESGGNVPAVKVSIPSILLTATLNPPGDFLMFISDSPIFSPSAEYRIMSTNGSNLETNFDFNGTKYITFGYAPERTYSRSIFFNGSTDYLDAGNKLNLNSAFTISAWIKKAANDNSIVSKRNSSFANGGYDFKINATGRLEMIWKNGTTQTITSSVIIPNNIWHQVAVVYNGVEAKLYIDGVEDVTQTKNLTAPISNTESFLIAAADGLATTSFFQGNIDEVRIWNVALTQEQLRFIMNQEIQRDGTKVSGSYFKNLSITPSKNDINSVDWTNLKGYYPMSTYTFTNCKDASDNGNTAAIKNLVTVDFQTAPLPYISAASTSWNLNSTWQNGSAQTIPGEASIIAATFDRNGDTFINSNDNYTIDWNIVQISNNVTLENSSLPSANFGNRTVLGLFVDATKQLEVTGTNPTSTDSYSGTGNGITVSHYLNLNGKIDLQGESQLIQSTDSDLVAGTNGVLERDQQGVGNKYRYNDWSSPVIKTGATVGSTFTVADVLRDGTNPNAFPLPNISFVGGYDGAIGFPLKIAEYWIYKYANDSHNNYSKWDQIKSTGALIAGEGFLMKGTGISGSSDQNYAFVGKPNNGDVTLTVNDNNDYLIGNPYPSAIDAEAFILDNPNIEGGTIYFWEHYGGNDHILKNYQAGYATFNLSGGTKATSYFVGNGGNSSKKPGRYIAVGQGFFVQGNAIVGAKTINFKNKQRIFVKENIVDADTISVFMKSSNLIAKKTTNAVKVASALKDKRLKIWLDFETPKIDSRQLLLTFDERATEQVDWGFDGPIYGEQQDDLFWMIANKKFTIQGMNPQTNLKDIPLGLKLSTTGTVKIKIDKIDNDIADMQLFLKDSLLQKTYNLKESPFEQELEAGEYNDRFYLVFKPIPQVIEEDPDEIIEVVLGGHIFMNNEISELQIKSDAETKISEIKLVNYIGQTIKTWNQKFEDDNISLPVKLVTGVYIVQIKTQKGTINKKIIIN